MPPGTENIGETEPNGDSHPLLPLDSILDSILNLCVFPSHREGLGMGFHNGKGGMGGRVRAQTPRWLDPK